MRNLSLSLLFFSSTLYAWSNHGLSTYVALANTDLQKEPRVKAEKLEDFLESAKQSLALALPKIDQKIEKLDLNFTKLPQKFNAELKGAELKKSFLHAIRVNTKVPYSLYLQDIPSVNLGTRNKINIQQASIIKDVGLARKHLLNLADKEEITPLLVVATYVDEPDFGMDIGLFEDSDNSEDGKLYGFGKLPFGNPRLEFATQAPFHMGFYFESWLTYTFKSEIKRTFPLARILQYRELSRFAFKEGHPYWGYRFAAWALHYIQDLSQPYHSTLVPGSNDIEKVWAAFVSKSENRMMNEITNLHLGVEDYQFNRLAQALENNKSDDFLVLALKTPQEAVAKLQRFEHIKDIVAKDSNQEAEKLRDALVEAISPNIYLSNDTGKIDFFQLIEALPEDKKNPLYEELKKLMGQLGNYTRDFILTIKSVKAE